MTDTFWREQSREHSPDCLAVGERCLHHVSYTGLKCFCSWRFNVIARVWSSIRSHLGFCKRLFDLGDCDQFFDCNNLTSDLWADWVKDRSHSLPQTKGFEDAGGFLRQADGRADQCDFEERHGR